MTNRMEIDLFRHGTVLTVVAAVAAAAADVAAGHDVCLACRTSSLHGARWDMIL